jgi:hypothetical protein
MVLLHRIKSSIQIYELERWFNPEIIIKNAIPVTGHGGP